MPTNTRFAWTVTAVNSWILGGLFLDGWWHIRDGDLETFFTPWHGVMYSGVLAAIFVMVSEVQRRRAAGQPAFAPGYLLSAIGGVVFVSAAVADMVWHETLGIEVGVEALLSPPHLALATAGVLVFGGPLRAALRGAGPTWPAVVATAQVLALLGFFTQYASPVVQRHATLSGGAGGATDARHALGMAALVLSSALIAGAVLLVAKVGAVAARGIGVGTLPLGAVTTLVVGPMMLLVTLRNTHGLLAASVVAGVAGDVAARRAGPRAAAIAAPAAFHAAVFATFAVQGVLRWSPALTSGGVVLAAATGALVGILATPAPTLPAPPAPEVHERARDAVLSA